MADIVGRLRAEVDPDVNEPLDRLLDEAADEIERLRTALRLARVERELSFTSGIRKSET
jgi:hypothetical protein